MRARDGILGRTARTVSVLHGRDLMRLGVRYYCKSFSTLCGVELAVANTLVPACVRI